MIKYQTQVVKGHGRGRFLGYPTINMTIPVNFEAEEGIYAGFVWLEGEKYWGAFHYGPVPTFDQSQKSLEVFVLDTRLEEVSPEIEFELIKRLRPVQTFDSSQALIYQISQDITQARDILSEYDKAYG